MYCEDVSNEIKLKHMFFQRQKAIELLTNETEASAVLVKLK